MTGTQSVTVAIVLLAALASVMFNNVRISDLRTDLNARMGDLRSDMNDRFADVNRHIDDQFALLSQQMSRMEENIMRNLGEHETRLQKLEGRQ